MDAKTYIENYIEQRGDAKTYIEKQNYCQKLFLIFTCLRKGL